MVRAVALAALAAALAGCNPLGGGWSFACADDSKCGEGGKCLSGYCAFVDGTCTSGYRFGELSGPVADQCWAPGDGGLPDDANPGCSSAYLVCDGFEAATLDPRWTFEGTALRDVTVAHRGTASLRVHTAAIAAGTRTSSRIREQVTLAGTTTFWARAWFRISQSPVSTNAMQVFDAEPASGASGIYVFVRATETTVFSGFDNQGQGGGGVVPINTWFCLVWNVVRSTSATGSMSLTSDTLTPVSSANTITDGATPIAYLGLGIYWAPGNVDVAQPAVDLWVDDIITDDAAVSCSD